MRIEIVSPEAMSTSNNAYNEIADGVYRSEKTGEVLIVDGNGQRAVIVNPDTHGTD